jgi:restriction system protein
MTDMPNWEGFMIPTLTVLRDGVTRHRREINTLVADALSLTEAQRDERLASGDRRYENRIGWALSFMTNVGALARPRRGHYEITDAGRQLIDQYPQGVSERQIKFLGESSDSPIRVYESRAPRSPREEPMVGSESELTPIEQVQSGIDRIRDEVAVDLLGRLREMDPALFEETVVDLLLAMGYGGTTGAGTVTQLSNDGGIDGVIDQDVLGLNRVYVQAKRYKTGNTIGRPDLQAFVGALSGKADSGVFITTSSFSEGARTYAAHVPTRIILIDGERLAGLRIRYGVGVQVRQSYKVVEIDEDFFA